MHDAWIETRNGIKFHFLDPQPDEIIIEDIAYALSNQCRYNGHCSRYYSVAEHSVLVSALVPEEFRLEALLHDAAEAFLSDIPSPIKQFMPEYKKLEEVVESAIMLKFGLMSWNSPEVKKADRQQLCTEAYNLLPSRGDDWTMWGDNKPDFKDGRQPMCFAPRDAYGLFMSVFTHLTKPKILTLNA